MKKPVNITKTEILKIYRLVPKTAHKGTQGHALIIGGSYGKMGAMCLSAKAALKSGSGLVTAFVPKCGYEILQISIPEVMVITDQNKDVVSKIKFGIEPNAIGIGPGMGKKKRTQNAFHKFLKSNKIPLVIDADALNILSQNREWLSLLPPKTILTPHPKELERLIGEFSSEDQKLQAATDFAKTYDLILVMKGAPTVIVHNDQICKNTTGNQALATAGSGDVLTGIITGLLAQGYLPFDATKLGVYLHGLTADISISKTGYESFVASEIIDAIGSAFLSLKSTK